MKYEDGKAYDQNTDKPYYRLWFEMIEHYLAEYLPTSGTVLDAGGGTGEFSIRAAILQPDISIVNLDISEDMLDTAATKIRKLGLDSRVINQQGDIIDIPFADDSFEYVMCFGDALSFCTDIDRAFSELVRVARKDYYLHLSVNSFWGNFHAMLGKGPDLGYSYSDVMEYYRSRIIHKEDASTGCRSFTLEELREIGNRNGMEIVRIFGAPVFPTHDDWLEETETAEKIRKLQYMHCENRNLVDFGNHLNVIYKKQ